MANLFRCGGGRSEASYQNLMDQLVEETATGPIASFADGANNIPVKEIVCHINPTETGTGEKSPSNPYVIGGFTEVNITQTDGQTPPIISKLYTVPFGQTVYGAEVDVINGVAHITHEITDMGDLSYAYQSSQRRFYTLSLANVIAKEGPTNWKIPPLCEILKEAYNTANDKTIALYYNGLVYFVDWDYNNSTDFKTFVTGKKICYKLADPFDIQLTPTEIKTLLGANNLYHDCNGDIDVTYRANGALYVQEHPITRGLMAARPTEQIQEQEEQQEEKEINKSEDNER